MTRADKSVEWAAATIEGWHGPSRKGLQTYAEAFHAAWANQANAGALLAAVASAPDAPLDSPPALNTRIDQRRAHIHSPLPVATFPLTGTNFLTTTNN